jgi:hypothetical protein
MAQHLHSFYISNGYTKLAITAQQDIRTPECRFVTKRYFYRRYSEKQLSKSDEPPKEELTEGRSRRAY